MYLMFHEYLTVYVKSLDDIYSHLLMVFDEAIPDLSTKMQFWQTIVVFDENNCPLEDNATVTAVIDSYVNDHWDDDDLNVSDFLEMVSVLSHHLRMLHKVENQYHQHLINNYLNTI